MLFETESIMNKVMVCWHS